MDGQDGTLSVGESIEVDGMDDVQAGVEGDLREWVWFVFEGGIVEGFGMNG